MSSTLLQRARESGKCAPSLLPSEETDGGAGDGFEASVLKVLDAGGFRLAPEASAGDDCASLLQNLASVDSIATPTSDEAKKTVLAQRRSIILAVVGGTPTESPSLSRLLSKGYLDSVKTWLDDILSGSVGGVDLLLHLLSNIVQLPVTKSLVKVSGMGKAIGSIEKHRIVVDTPNESVIKERVQKVKEAWQASVKARKSQGTSETKAGAKRPVETDQISPSAAKRIKSGDDATKNKSSPFSSLIKTLSGSSGKPSVGSKKSPDKVGGSSPSEGGAKSKPSATNKNKGSKRVKWADHFGGTLTAAQLIEGDETSEGAQVVSTAGDVTVSWSDRKKRDRMREKELLAKAKKAKLLDDFEDDLDVPVRPAMQTTMAWKAPPPLPDRPDVTKPQLTSTEISLLNERMNTIPEAQYASEFDIPSSPAPLSDVEQALDMTSQSSAVVQPIPFFVPQQQAEPVVETPSSYTNTQPASTASQPAPVQHYAPPVPVGGPSSGATPDFVQSLGLPLFLVGQDTQALQTLANSPSLLSTLVGPNGMYDQARLLSLVQTLSSSNANQAPPNSAPSAYQQPSPGIYGPSSTAPAYGQAQSSFPGAAANARNGYHGGSNDGNLHISGYGPMTTEADIIAFFAPYVQVDEVVIKGTFAFVNTSDPINAQRAREALNGSLMGGLPIKISRAQRKNRDNAPVAAAAPPPPMVNNGVAAFPGHPPGAGAIPGGAPPGIAPVMPDVDAVRDDRGNPATKNLFVAGYGPGTTEQQIRDLFSQHVNVVGVVLKGSFTFVNTSDRESAVRARQMLGGTRFNGGVLRINFAKETGRLGTSFDLTYGPNTGPNPQQRPGPPPGGLSYYGRG